MRWWVSSYIDKRRMSDMVNAAVQELTLREDIYLPNPTYTHEYKIGLSDEEVRRIALAIKNLDEEN